MKRNIYLNKLTLKEAQNKFNKTLLKYGLVYPLKGELISTEDSVGLITAEPNFAKEIEAELTCNIGSDSGREDYVRVFVYKEGERFYAEPILGKSGLISTMVRASGLIKIGLNIEGLEKGSKVMVKLF